MSHTVEIYEHAGLKVEIIYDEHCMSPREDRDGLARLVTWHRRSRLGDEQISLDDVRASKFKSDENVIAYFRKERKAAIILPVYLYEHSGMTIRTTPFGDPWDSGLVGFIYATNAMIREWNMIPRNKAIPADLLKEMEKTLVAEIDEYNKYLSGECYGYVVHSTDSRVEEESCWGFIGDEYVKQEANDTAERMAVEIAELPLSPYEVIVKQVSTGKELEVVGDAQAALDSDSPDIVGGFFLRQIRMGIAELQANA